MYKVVNDGFVWLIVDEDTATAILKDGNISLYALYDDGTEGAIDNIEDIKRVKEVGLEIGIEVGFIRDLLPKCPKCGSVLSPSRIEGYTWECLECNEDFFSTEI